jgi:uncharacterized repeat protein (TIGR01451 family)
VVSDDGTNGVEPDTDNNSDYDTDLIDAAPNYSITKTDGEGFVSVGDALTYTISVANDGNQTGTNISVVDTFPTDMLENIVASDSGIVDMEAGTITWNIGALNAGDSLTYTVTARVRDAVSAGHNGVTNTVTITDDGSSGVDPTPSNNQSQDTDLLNATPELELTKTSSLSGTVRPGTSFDYVLTLTNNGNQGATGVAVTDVLDIGIVDANSVTTDDPANVSYDSATGRLIWSVGELDGGGSSQQLTVTVTVQNPVTTTIVQLDNTASVVDDDLNGVDSNPGNDEDTDTVTVEAEPDYVITKVDNLVLPARPQLGYTYTIAVENVGDQDGTGVVVTDSLPINILAADEVTFDDSTNVVYDSDTGLITWSIGDLAGRGGTATLEVSVIVLPLPTLGVNVIVNTAAVTDDLANGADPTPENNIATHERDLIVFVFDSGRDHSGQNKSLQSNDRDESLGGWLPATRTLDMRHLPIAVDSMFSGAATPGSVLVGRIYDADGNLIGNQQVVTDAGGNWLMSFPNTVIWEQPHRMSVEQVGAVYQGDDFGGLNLRRYFHPVYSGPLFFSDNATPTTVLRALPNNVLDDIHQANLNPLGFGLSGLQYESLVSSINAAQR